MRRASQVEALPSRQEVAAPLPGNTSADISILHQGKIVEALGSFPEVLSTDDVATVFGIKPDTARARLRLGEIPGIRIGRRWYVLKFRLIEVLMGGDAHV